MEAERQSLGLSIITILCYPVLSLKVGKDLGQKWRCWRVGAVPPYKVRWGVTVSKPQSGV